jgi:hypothetical protein
VTAPGWDPLSRNPYRLLGITREASVDPATFRPRPMFQPPVLEAVEQTPEVLNGALEGLANPEYVPFYRATWFDASRPLDQIAYADVLEGRLQEAWYRWSNDRELLSSHNLTLLTHLRWLFQPDDWQSWRACAESWRDLYERNPEPGYALVIEGFQHWTSQLAYQHLTRGNPEGIRRCLLVLRQLSTAAEGDKRQTELLEDDCKKVKLGLATLREQILQDADVGEVTSRFEQEVLPVLNFVLSATLEDSALHGEVRRELCLFYRLLGRTWHAHKLNSDALVYAEAWLQKALDVAPEDLRGEIRAELEHWRITRIPVQATAFSQSGPGPEEKVRRGLGGLILFVTLVALGATWSSQRPRGLPWGQNLTRPAVVKRIDEILTTISPLAERLAELSVQIERAPNLETRERLRRQHAEVKQKHADLKAELINLQKWLELHQE